MKKISIFLCLTSTCIVAEQNQYDFNYYKQKTRELLPILGIDEANIIFAPTHKDISFEQRIKNPKTIFLNIEKLPQLSEYDALLECVLQAQLATVDWNRVIPHKKTFLAKYLVSSILTIETIACIFLTLRARHRTPVDLFGIYFFSSLTTVAVLLACWTWHNEYTTALTSYEEDKASNFHHEHYIKLGTLFSLLAHENTALLAFIGLDRNFDRFESYSVLFKFMADWVRAFPEKWLEIKLHLTEKTVTCIERTVTILQLLAPLQDWIHAHPDEWQDIKKTLPSEFKALFDASWFRLSHPSEFLKPVQ